MTARLAGFVHVDGLVFGPGDEVPPEVAAKITNPKAWVDGALPEAATVSETEPPGFVSTLPEPPRSGPGATKAAWAEYVVAGGWTVKDGMSRDDIIEALDSARREG